MSERFPDPLAGLSRRAFLERAAAMLALLSARDAGACEVPVTAAPWPSADGWEHRTVAQFPQPDRAR
jgi:hypothetical protein